MEPSSNLSFQTYGPLDLRGFPDGEDVDHDVESGFPVIPTDENDFYAPSYTDLVFPDAGGDSTFTNLTDESYFFGDFSGFDVEGGGESDAEDGEDETISGRQVVQDVADGDADIGFLDHEEDGAIGYNFATSFNDRDHTIVPAPSDYADTTTSVSAQMDAYYAKVGLPVDRPFESRIVFTDSFGGGVLASYNNDNGRVAVSVDNLRGQESYGDTLLHEGVHAIIDDSGLSDQITAHLPGVDGDDDHSLSLEEGLAEYAVLLVDPGRDIVEHTYEREVDFVVEQVLPRIDAQGADGDAVLERAFGGDIDAQQLIVNAARDAYGLPPVELGANTISSAGTFEDPETGSSPITEDFGFFDFGDDGGTEFIFDFTD